MASLWPLGLSEEMGAEFQELKTQSRAQAQEVGLDGEAEEGSQEKRKEAWAGPSLVGVPTILQARGRSKRSCSACRGWEP